MKVNSSYITSEQIEAIKTIIIHQADLLAKEEKFKREFFSDLHYENYMKGRNQYSNTLGILSGFRKTTKLPEMQVREICYGLHLVQPELESETAIVQIYSSGSKLKTKEIKQKSRKAASIGKSFFIFQFYLNSNALLNKIDLVQLDGNANEVSRNTIYTRTPQMIRYPA